MAYFSLSSAGSRKLRFTISDLGYKARDYDYFYITDLNCGTGSGAIPEYQLDWNRHKKTYFPSGSSYSFSDYFTGSGLSPDTRYKLYAYAKINGRVWYIGNDYAYTDEEILEPPRPQSIWLNERGTFSLSIGWNSVSYANRYDVKWKNTNNGRIDQSNTSATSYRISGLASGTPYDIYIRGTNNSSDGEWSYIKTWCTNPNTPKLTVYEKTKSHIKIQASVSGGFDYVNVYCSQTNETIRLNKGSNMIASFYNLNSGKEYSFSARAYIYYDGSLSSDSSNISATTISNPRPNNWWWWTEKTSTTCRLSSDELNSLTKRINEFRRYKGLSDYSFYTMRPGIKYGDQHYNQLINAINPMINTGVPLASDQQKFKISDFSNNLNRIVNRLNSIT